MAISKSKKKALEVMSVRGGTEHERTIAKAMLAAQPKSPQVPAIPKMPRWKGDGIARPEGGNPILSSQITHFLKNITDNTPFSYKSIPYTDNFGSGHFYSIVNFLESHGLLSKEGGKYYVKSKAKVRDAWNHLMESAKV